MRGYRPPHPGDHRTPVGPPVAIPGRLIGIRGWPLSFDSSGAVRLGIKEKAWRSGGESTWAECRGGVRGSRLHPADAIAPAAACSCGLYAVHPFAASEYDLWRRVGDSCWIHGIVEAWGRVHVHAEGFRAQYARPVAIALVGRPRRSDLGRMVEDVAIAHRAELLELPSASALVDHCLRRGLGMTREAVRILLHSPAPRGVRADGGNGQGGCTPPPGSTPR